MTSLQRRRFLALGAVGAGAIAVPARLRAQAPATVADTLAGDARFTRFLDLVTRASAVENFRQPGPLTLFAPVDEAFARAPAGILQDLLTLSYGRGSDTAGDSSNRNRWLALINYHVVPGAFRPEEISGADRRLRTVNGADVQISGSGNNLRIGNPAPAQQIAGFGAFGAQANPTPAQVVGPPVLASNGIIYPIDQILWP